MYYNRDKIVEREDRTVKKLLALALCLLILSAMPLSLVLPISADQPVGDDIFHDAPGGNEYKAPVTREEALPAWTVSLISISVIVLLCIVVGWLYCLLRKKKK